MVYQLISSRPFRNLFCYAVSVMFLILLSSCARTIKYPPNSRWSQEGISSLETIKANGLKHSVLIRGVDKSNPILLFIHPMGIPSMCFAHLEYAQSSESVIEKRFVVIHYDQRGFGKTYIHGKHMKRQLLLENYVCDAESLVHKIRERFGNRKIYLLGESWGSQIAVRLAAKHPDWFYALISMGQNTKGSDMLNNAYTFCLNEAEEEKNAKAIKDLNKVGPPRQEMSNRSLYKSMSVAGRWIDYYLAKKYNYNSDAGIFFKSLWQAPEYSFLDFEATLTSYITTNKKIIREACFNDLNSIRKIDVPVFMIMGEYDFWLPIAKKYFDSLQVPLKQFFVIKGAGHMVRGDKPNEVEDIIYNKVLPATLN